MNPDTLLVGAGLLPLALTATLATTYGQRIRRRIRRATTRAAKTPE